MPQVISQSPILSAACSHPCPYPICSKLYASTSITWILTTSLYDQFSDEETGSRRENDWPRALQQAWRGAGPWRPHPICSC